MKMPFKKRILLIGIGAITLFSSLGFKSDFLEIAKQLEIFTTLFKELNMNYVDQTDPADLMDSAIHGLLSDLDPYTHYWNEQDVETNRITNSGEYTGIGATVNIMPDKIVIVEAYKDYPADKAGLRAGDAITQIGEVVIAEFPQNPGELLQGVPESQVELTYQRQGEKFTTTLTREAVEIKAVPFYTLIKKDIGYLVLSQFNQHISEETRDALEDLKKQGAKKIILDLRNNPGGLLSEAINVANIFLPEGELVVSTKSAIEKYNQTYYTTRKAVDTEIPLVVLINGRSASASEILAGALQDLDRAVVIGARSFGKGLVQRPKDLSYGTQLKVTISRYYTPSGRGIQSTDYRLRDEEGNPLSIAPEKYDEFRTRNGRRVYDGGGITPDIEMASSKFSEITNALLIQNAIFDFATHYYYTHEVETLQNFTFTSSDYEDFKDFLNEMDFTYETFTERHLKESMLMAKHEGFEAAINQEFEKMIADINTAKNKNLKDKKEEIVSLLSDEIIKRYFYKEGLYNYRIEKNPEILKAKEILDDPSRMEELLGA